MLIAYLRNSFDSQYLVLVRPWVLSLSNNVWESFFGLLLQDREAVLARFHELKAEMTASREQERFALVCHNSTAACIVCIAWTKRMNP